MSRKLALLSLLGCLALSGGVVAQPLDSGHPIIPLLSDLNPYPGELVMVTVPFSASASSAGTITISSSTMSNFDILPSSVSYNSGDSSVSFYALIDPLATGSIQITASSSAGSASMSAILSGPPTSTATEPDSITASIRF